MNKDQVKGKAKDVAGKVQEKAGELTGSEEQQVKGEAKQVEGLSLRPQIRPWLASFHSPSSPVAFR